MGQEVLYGLLIGSVILLIIVLKYWPKESRNFDSEERYNQFRYMEQLSGRKPRY